MTPNTLTYGDTFTLDAAPGVIWKVCDARTLESLGGAHAPAWRGELRATLSPVTADGSRRTDALKIGRAKREYVSIDAHVGDDGGVRFIASTPTHAESLTTAQRTALEAGLAALRFDLPPLTAAEIQTRYVEAVRSEAELASYSLRMDDSRITGSHMAGLATDLMRAALTPATRAAAADAAVRVLTERILRETGA